MNTSSSKNSFLESLLNGTAKLREEISSFLMNESDEAESIKKSGQVNDENSIIDVTNESYKIPQTNPTNNHHQNSSQKVEVPHWQHQYVYSYSEINSATQEQRRFYFYLKNKFYNQEFVDLQDNSNYAFILLFDLLQEYDQHKKIVLLESQLQLLGEFYPKTNHYAGSFLAKKLEARGDFDGALRVRIEYQNSYYDYWKLGSKYKRPLSLSNEEVKLLNQVNYSSNNFVEVEFCCLEVIKLYLSTIKIISKQIDFNEQIRILADLTARKQFRYRLNSQNYKYCIGTFPNEIYTNIFKNCENTVREFYGHKRKLNADSFFTNSEVKNELELRISSNVKEILTRLVSKIALPDEKTEIELNAKTHNRWKLKFTQLTAEYNNNAKQFVEDIIRLGNFNKKNPAIENIFFEASKFIAKSDRHASLTLYVYYLYHDLKSANFDNKKLPKTIQKYLFKNEDQQLEFENLINDLVSNRDLQKALREISEIYAIKRRKIQLDSDSIKEVQEQHSGTVKLLNSVLNDEYEALNEFLLPELELMVSYLQANGEKIEISPNAKSSPTQEKPTISKSMFRDELNFSELQIKTLEHFQNNNLAISQSDLENLARANGALKNKLIDDINDACYEFLDDVLIEEDDDSYTIYENYFNKILNQC